VEFETKINNGVAEVPARYSNISESGGNVRVIIVPIKKQSNSSFDSKQYFGVGRTTKDEIDLYLKHEGDFGIYTQRATGRVTGSLIGGYSGAVIGASIGGLFGGFGAIPGGIIGGIIGDYYGSEVGEQVVIQIQEYQRGGQ